MNIGFTGTASGMTDAQKKSVRHIIMNHRADRSIFHHGDCIGADMETHRIARNLGYIVMIHPPISEGTRAWCRADILRKQKSYLDRNHDIVNESEILIVTPKGYKEELRSGTWATYRYARKIKKKIFLVLPSGSVEVHDFSK